jgi:HK97 family phage major capsid protein
MSAHLKKIQEQRGAKVKELDAIISIARREGRGLNADEAKKYDAIEAEVKAFDADAEREIRHIATMSQRSPLEQYSQSEQRDINRFDIGRCLRALDRGTSALDGVEGELLAEGAKEALACGIGESRMVLPRVVVQRRGAPGRERRAVTATGTTSVTGDQGAMTIQTNVMGLLDAFYEALVLPAAGATVLTGLQGNFNWPRYLKTANGTIINIAENATPGGISPTVSQVSFSPKRLATFVDVSDQLIIQSNEVITQVLSRNIQQQASVLAEQRAIFGSGSSNQPLGIINTSGIGSVVGGTNGAAPTWAALSAITGKVDQANAIMGNLGWLANAKTKTQLQTTLKNNVTGTDSRYIYDPDQKDAMLAGYTPHWTNSVPSNLTKGSANAICSAIIFGNFADLVQAFWGGVTLDIVRDVASAKAGQRTLVLNMYHDNNVVRAESFAAMLDVLTPNA